MSKASLDCFSAIFNIRRTLQDYKKSEPPEVQFYKVSRKDLLDMLHATMIAWYGLVNIELEVDELISALTNSNKKEEVSE